ncbi:SIR2 family NAD-dependent protein deacylase [Pusillimonas sp.]|uniref:SIR2 family NAD-dependent protein deacylase n=1 Tax=Pusillimonas sp. TaxID=3040095 RepID=UPI0037CC288B
MDTNIDTGYDRSTDVDSPISESAWQQALYWLERADGLIITAGAGMGVDSGLPDFRGNEGLWRAYPALRQSRLEFTRIASPAAFRREPELAWGFYGHRLELYRKTTPHEGFAILRRWADRVAQGAFVYTSNVDGQFKKAGFLADRILECHGTLHWLQCMEVCRDALWTADGWVPEVDATACRLLSPLPTCPACGALARPNVLMFNDGDWVSTRTDHQQQRLETWLSGVSQPVVVELGAGTAVPTVRWFGSMLNVPLIRINLRESEISKGQGVGLAGRALEVLSELDRRWNKEGTVA